MLVLIEPEGVIRLVIIIAVRFAVLDVLIVTTLPLMAHV
jgi:hypothetical protein